MVNYSVKYTIYICRYISTSFLISNASDINVEISVRFIYLYNSFSITRTLFKIRNNIVYELLQKIYKVLI